MYHAKILEISFKHVIQFSYQLGSGPAELFEKENSADLEKILIESYGYIPLDKTFKFYTLEDIDDFPFIQIIAEAAK